jgi:hypothetical protein
LTPLNNFFTDIREEWLYDSVLDSDGLATLANAEIPSFYLRQSPTRMI